MVNPGERAYQLQSLWASKCPGCRNCAQILMEHPDVIRLECYVCGSACEPARPWAQLAFANDAATEQKSCDTMRIATRPK